ncbi:MAG: hypothetical protein ACLFU8_06465 [Anaerolineales bacterium]
MDLLTRADLQELTEQQEQEGPHVSIYIPTHRAGPGRETGQDRIELKNRLNEAEEKLVEKGLRLPEAQKMLEPARALLNNTLVWQYMSDGLALFLAKGYQRALRLPLDFEPLLVVDSRFHLTPLLPLLNADARFYILGLSQDNIRVFGGTNYTVVEISPESLPESLTEALGAEEYQQPLFMQMSTRAMGGQMAGDHRGGHKRRPIGGRDAAPKFFHGQSYETEEEKKRIRKFFNWLDNELESLISAQVAPLVLAGEERVMHLYREVSNYPYLAKEGVEINIKVAEPEALHREAWPLVAEHFTVERRERAVRFKELATNAPDMVSTDVEEIVPSAYFERVDTLYVRRGAHVWGTFDPESNSMEIYDEPQAGAQDLLDLAALYTYLNSGTVYLVADEEMPASAPVAALFRYGGEFPEAGEE